MATLNNDGSCYDFAASTATCHLKPVAAAARSAIFAWTSGSALIAREAGSAIIAGEAGSAIIAGEAGSAIIAGEAGYGTFARRAGSATFAGLARSAAIAAAAGSATFAAVVTAGPWIYRGAQVTWTGITACTDATMRTANELSPTTKKCLVAAGVGAATYVALPVAVAAAGFTAGGVKAGSTAAIVHSSLGNVVQGSIFAKLQSAGVLGLAGTTKAAVSGIYGLGGWVGSGWMVSNPLPPQTEEKDLSSSANGSANA